MAAKARRKITITYSNDVEGEQEINAATNTESPAMIEQVTLEDNSNTIDVPAGATAVTIVKPTDNETAIYLVSPTGHRLHDTDPDTISLHEDVTAITLWLGPASAGEEVPTVVDDVVVRLFWS